MSRSRFLLGSFLALFAIQGAAFCATSDVVQLFNKNRIPGKVTTDNANGVELKTPDGSRMNFARKQVKFVEYANTPNDYTAGLQSYNRGDYRMAIGQLQDALNEQHSPHLKQYIYYYMASSLQKSGNLKSAEKAYTKIAKQGKKSRFMFESFSAIIEINIQLKNIKKASEMRKRLMGVLDVRETNAPASIMFFGARIEEAKRNWRKALQGYKKAASDEDYRIPSTVAIVRCHIGADKASEAVREAKKALRLKDMTGEPRAELYVLFGDGLLAKGDNNAEDALFAYLRVATSVLTGTYKVEVNALKGAAKAFEVLGNKSRADKMRGLISRVSR